MVKAASLPLLAGSSFQYSLCRVVLMVPFNQWTVDIPVELSVLALSSRFDGHDSSYCILSSLYLSVLALSSRFDGHFIRRTRTG